MQNRNASLSMQLHDSSCRDGCWRKREEHSATTFTTGKLQWKKKLWEAYWTQNLLTLCIDHFTLLSKSKVVYAHRLCRIKCINLKKLRWLGSRACRNDKKNNTNLYNSVRSHCSSSPWVQRRLVWLLKECLASMIKFAGKGTTYYWYSHYCPQSTQAPPPIQARHQGGDR